MKTEFRKITEEELRGLELPAIARDARLMDIIVAFVGVKQCVVDNGEEFLYSTGELVQNRTFEMPVIEKKIERAWLCINDYGYPRYFFADGRCPDFENDTKECHCRGMEALARKEGPWVDIDIDTFEIVARGNDNE